MFFPSAWLLYQCCSFFFVSAYTSMSESHWTTPFWKWLRGNLSSNILPVLLSCCRELGVEQSHTKLAEHHLKWLATPQNVRLFGIMPQALISFCSSSWGVGKVRCLSHFPYLCFVWVFVYSILCVPLKPNCCLFGRVLELVSPLGGCVLFFGSLWLGFS